ncbi:MAG: glucose-6-phosphate isomerase [Nevskia sp.]|nr:glucose-6-phosphate isomerase [Nevskia sp.]
MAGLTESPAWLALRQHAQELQGRSIASLFEVEPERVQRCSAEAVGLYLDYSKQRIDARGLQLLLALARQQGLQDWTARLFAGEAVNSTEHRAAYHMALRAPREARFQVAGHDVMADVHGVLDRMYAFAAQVRGGAWRGATGEPISDVVNIGIGGSDLGPRMVCRALDEVADGPRVHFVANVDGAQLTAVLHGLEPATTLFIVTSKTFTTQETMANAQAARRWSSALLGEHAIGKHFVAVSTNRAEVEKFGIDAANMFGFWDWVGGRYSLWSAVGLVSILALGPERFGRLLAGAHAMDEHFRSAPPEQNLPVLLGLLNAWNTNFLGARTQVIAPYAQDLEYFVAWLQQLEMESNGKGVDRAGHSVDYATTPAVWGDVGTNSQHAFFQMLHQGPTVQPVDFILPLRASHPLQDQQRMLAANCLAQSAALMRGKTAAQVRAELQAKGLAGAALEEAIPHRVFTGNRPSNTILLPQLDPYSLGALLALYEHRTFVQSVVWNINAFDQWGVELGKQLAQSVLAAMGGDGGGDLDSSTRALLGRVRDAAA